MVDNSTLERLLAFRRERDWEQFHTVRNLAISISVEAAELLENFQWANDHEIPKIVAERREAISDEIADVAIYLTYLANDLGLNIDDCVRSKLAKNEAKYPADRARGRSDKYDQLK